MPGRTAAMTAQALALIAAGLVLVVGALTAPAAPPVEREPMRWRAATEQERRDYEARRLAAALDELAAQRGHGSPQAVTPVLYPTQP